MEGLGEKSLPLLSNSKPTGVVDRWSPGYWGKPVVREGNNPDRG